MKKSLYILYLLLLLLLISVTALIIPVPGQALKQSSNGNKLIIVTPHWDGIRNEFGRAFPKYYKEKTGKEIFIEWLDVGGTSDCIKYIKSEFKRNKKGIKVDLFFGGGTDPYIELKRLGYLSPVKIRSDILDSIPQNFSGIEIYDQDYCWYGAVLSGFGIIYNKWVCDWLKFSPPRGWKDLAKQEYVSWVGVADPRNSGTMHLMFEIILQAYGWEEGWKILTGMSANARTFSKGASDVPRMVARGDMAFGLAIDFYGWAEVAAAGEEKVGFILPEELTVVSADGVGILKGAPNRQAAVLFTEFVLSEEGQKIWFLKKGVNGGPVEQELNRMSVRPDFYTKYLHESNVRQNPFEKLGSFHFNHDLASKRWGIINDLFGISIINNYDDLVIAWKKIGVENQAWNSVVINESRASTLADNIWDNPVEKNAILLKWNKFYKKKYRDISRGSL